MSIDNRLIDVAADSPIGKATPRRDGHDKVTGAARYTAEFHPEGTLHGVVVTSTIPAGTLTAIDTGQAEAMPGVRAVFTHLNAPALAPVQLFVFGPAYQSFLPLQDDRIRFIGQIIALVVADTFEQATDAASRVHATCQAAPFVPGLHHPDAVSYGAEDCGAMKEAVPDLARGDAEAALAQAPVALDVTYTSPRQYAAAMEPHATVARWEANGTLTVWDTTQWIAGSQAGFAAWFKIPPERVRVITLYLGGGFGSKGAAHPHSALAALAARELGRPVKIVLTRPQQFTCTSPRPAIRQRLRLGAEADGTLTALTHETLSEVSYDDLWVEPCGALSALSYAVPNQRSTYRLVRVNAVTPGALRGPGEAMGSFALESAMDELAVELGIDPIELRLRNYAEHDQVSGKPWSSKNLRQAYEQGAAAFGWDRRPPAPRSTREGHELIGWGMAGVAFPRNAFPTAAGARVRADGGVEVFSAGTDIGTGTYTLLAQVAADVFAITPQEVTVRLGDSSFPESVASGGSMLAGSLTPVAHQAATAVRQELLHLAATLPDSPLRGRPAEELAVGHSRVYLAARPETGLNFADILRRAGREQIEAVRDSFGDMTDKDRRDRFGTFTLLRLPAAGTHSVYSWGAVFAEVAVDEDLGTVRLRRLLGAFDCGRILNPATARSQLLGAMVMASGAALLEAAVVDPGPGRLANPNLAEYMLPVNADIPDIDVLFVGEPDPHSNPLGTKGVGETGITGTVAAIANAVHHATGKRVRDLPILMEKML
ncbi:xanthine dehydrogenase family protein molybdopterin-binding subunit [Nonomuraea sp. NPDC050394]|uniref:xanthine dehydrogenase family protein molybdopterin-binding subunit n=1 Tax=Nonomuraea sp. NPDC050394 TaxID=3364363 RepID=UPI003797A8A6